MHLLSFFFMNLTNLVGCLWQRQEVRVNLRKGNSDGDILSVIMCFPMTLLTNYEYQNIKHASSFFFFYEFNQPCRMLMAASRS